MNPLTHGPNQGRAAPRSPTADPTEEAEDAIVVSLPHGAEASALARNFIAEHAQQLPDDLLADAQLLVSEIVANAVLHGRPDISMRVRISPPGIGVAVLDAGPELDATVVTPAADDAVSGRGLLIVDAVASAWGIDSTAHPPGKSVWFELAAEPPRAEIGAEIAQRPRAN